MKQVANQSQSPRQIRILFAIFLSTTIVGFGLGALHPLVALLMHQRGFSGKEIGLATAVYSLANIVVPFFIPRILRRTSITFSLLVAIFGFCGSALLYYFLFHLAWILPVRFFHGCCVAFIFTLSEFLMNDVTTDQNRGIMVGLYATLLSIGFSLGPFSLYLFGTSSFLPFVVVVLASLAAAFPILFLVRSLGSLSKEHALLENVLFMVKKEPVAILAPMAYGAIEMAVFSLLPIYLKNIGLSDKLASLSIAAFVLGNILFQIPMGFISRVLHPKTLLWFAVFFALIDTSILIFHHNDLVITGVLLLLQGGLAGGIYTISLIHIGNQFRGVELMQVNSSFALYYAMGSFLGPLMGGIFVDHFVKNGFPSFLCGILALYFLFISGMKLAEHFKGRIKPGKIPPAPH